MAERRSCGDAQRLGRPLQRGARPLDVVVSSTVGGRVIGSGLAFEDAGEHEPKGVPDSWRPSGAVGG